GGAPQPGLSQFALLALILRISQGPAVAPRIRRLAPILSLRRRGDWTVIAPSGIRRRRNGGLNHTWRAQQTAGSRSGTQLLTSRPRPPRRLHRHGDNAGPCSIGPPIRNMSILGSQRCWMIEPLWQLEGFNRTQQLL